MTACPPFGFHYLSNPFPESSVIPVSTTAAMRRRRSSAVPVVLLLVALIFHAAGARLQAQGSRHSREEDSLLYVAASLIDEGDVDHARQILVDGAKRFPSNSAFVYEQCYILSAEKKHDECRKLLMTIIDAPDAEGTYHQLLGNTLDYLGEPAAAIAAYERGLVRFPDSGPLYLERGIMSAMKNDHEEAMKYWEEGIARDPSFASNYFHAARVWLQTKSPGWGLIYGEIFLNLEPKSERADLMRGALFLSWNQAVSIRNGTPKEPLRKGETMGGGVDLFHEIAITIEDTTKQPMFPFEFYYSGTVMYSSAPYLAEGKEMMTIADLHAIRSRFLDKWFQDTSISNHFAVDLFERQKTLRAAGLFEAYDYALFRSNETEKEYGRWEEKNAAKYFELQHWLIDNRIAVEPGVAFSRLDLKGLPIPERADE